MSTIEERFTVCIVTAIPTCVIWGWVPSIVSKPAAWSSGGIEGVYGSLTDHRAKRFFFLANTLTCCLFFTFGG